jgi:hypothetical protein
MYSALRHHCSLEIRSMSRLRLITRQLLTNARATHVQESECCWLRTVTRHRRPTIWRYPTFDLAKLYTILLHDHIRFFTQLGGPVETFDLSWKKAAQVVYRLLSLLSSNSDRTSDGIEVSVKGQFMSMAARCQVNFFVQLLFNFSFSVGNRTIIHPQWPHIQKKIWC